MLRGSHQIGYSGSSIKTPFSDRSSIAIVDDSVLRLQDRGQVLLCRLALSWSTVLAPCRTWKQPTGPEAYRELKEIKLVISHEIVTVWADLDKKVCSFLDPVRVTWTSVDVVCFAVVGKSPGPPIY